MACPHWLWVTVTTVPPCRPWWEGVLREQKDLRWWQNAFGLDTFAIPETFFPTVRVPIPILYPSVAPSIRTHDFLSTLSRLEVLA